MLGDGIGSLLHNFLAGMQNYADAAGRSDAIRGAGYVAHFVLKSEEDFCFRVAPGTGGNFGGQTKWKAHWEAGEAPAILAAMNEVEDDSLVRRSADTVQH